MAKLLKKRWCRLIVNIARCFWLIDLSEAHVLFAIFLMLMVTNATNVKNYSTRP